MTPLESYQQDLDQNSFHFDAAQQSVVVALDALSRQVQQQPSVQSQPKEKHRNWLAPLLLSKSAVWKKALSRLLPVRHEPRSRQSLAVCGIYLWGQVGRGKTYLMDSFYHSLPAGVGMRLHFHRFMQRVHRDLERCQGQKNPLQHVASQLACEARVLCLDEFFVEDIGDAMILATLLEAMFKQGMVLVATSNIAPDDLYRDGLQRQRFLAAIALIKRHSQVVALDGGQDYRRMMAATRRHFFSPLGPVTEQSLGQLFTQLSTGSTAASPAISPSISCGEGGSLQVHGRPIAVRQQRGETVWFDFRALCEGPRSQLDYIAISQRFTVVIVSDVPILGGSKVLNKVAIGTEDSSHNSIAFIDRSVVAAYSDDAARRFIALVDEFYDQRLRLIVSAAAPISQLYRGGALEAEFQRTISRLLAMQTAQYIPASSGA